MGTNNKTSGILSDIGMAFVLIVATENSQATEALRQFPWHNKHEVPELPEISVILAMRTFMLATLSVLMLVPGLFGLA